MTYRYDIDPGGELRPYEKFEQYGIDSLTSAELLAVIIKTGCMGKSAVELSKELLYGNTAMASFSGIGESTKASLGKSVQPDPDLTEERFRRNGGLLRLFEYSFEELNAIKGIGRVKAIQISCIIELAKRISGERAAASLVVSDPASVADYYMEELRHKSEEEAHLMLLTAKDTLIRSVMIARGTVSSAAVSPREIFMTALKYGAAAMILVHNHPSGIPEPSREDIHLSRELYRLGSMMNIHLRDSIIIGDNIYTSFLERGLFT